MPRAGADPRNERLKHTRYGPHVLPLAVESYGRWGKKALTWWRALAQQVARTDPHLRHLGAWAVPNLLQRWWAEVGTALQTANAEAIQGSLGVDPGGGGLSGAHPPLPHTLLLPTGAGADYAPSEAPEPV